MRICIVTPRHLSANPRVVKEATALHSAGHDVTIVCGDYIPGAAEIDDGLRHPEWKVRSVPFGRKVARPSVHIRQRVAQAIARFTMKAGVKSAHIETIAHAAVGADLTTAARNVRADLYIAHYVAALPAAARAAKRHGTSYAYDAEDYHLGDLPDLPKHALEKRIIRSVEGRYLPDAVFVTAASPLIAEAYVEAYGILKPTVILNVFPKNNGPHAPTPRGSVKPGPSLYWFSQTIGAGRGLETAVEAIALAQCRPHLHLRGIFASGYEATLRAHAARYGVADRLHVHPPVSPHQLEQVGAQFDVGYVGETGFSSNNSRALANKLFSYMISGIPIIASNTPSHQKIIEDIGEAIEIFSIGDAKDLAGALDRLLCDPSRLSDARNASWNLGHTRWNWEHEQSLLIDVVSTWLNASTHTPNYHTESEV